MPFNSTLPLASSQVSSAELRGQFNSLNDLIVDLTGQVATLQGQCDALQTQLDALSGTVSEGFTDRPLFDDMLSAIHTNAAANINSVAALDMNFSTPPTAGELDTVQAKLNEVIVGLQA